MNKSSEVPKAWLLEEQGEGIWFSISLDKGTGSWDIREKIRKKEPATMEIDLSSSRDSYIRKMLRNHGQKA